jgi:hypothetical protein
MATLDGNAPSIDDLAVLARAYPPATRGRVVVWGLLASYPFGGMAWQVLHYISGLRRLGFDVWYVEDSEQWVYDIQTYCRTPEYEPNVEYLDRYMRAVGLGDRWVFRVPILKTEVIGARNATGLTSLYREADAVFNVCGAQELRPEHDQIRCRVFVETDPVANQVRVANGDAAMRKTLDAHQVLFTYGENFGAPDCRVPLMDYTWHPTRPPVCVDWWQYPPEAREPERRFTTVANWSHTGKDVVWQGEVWRWSKDHEFRRFMMLPQRSPAVLEMAVGAIEPEDEQELRTNGWIAADSALIADPMAYYRYIRGSLAEFTVAKEQYVKPRSGWFSDRSVCYLAAGRPVITQSTGFENIIPTGEGLFEFTTESDVLAAIEAITGDYERHSKAALALAEEYFAAEKVIGAMVDSMGL